MMKPNFKNLALTVTLGSMLAACAPQSADLQSPIKGDPARQLKNGNVASETAHEPKVDILFVIDTSGSMGDHQENLKKNIDQFVAAFKKHSEIDFHIGAVSVWDSQRFNKENDKGEFIKEPMPLGKLRPLKNPSAPGQPVAGPQFVTRTEGFEAILGETLKLGIEDRADKQTGKDLGGPEFEEMFSPILPAIGNQNEGFYRADAHLAVVMITDADDASSLSASGLYKQLVHLKGNNPKLVSVHGALALTCSKVDQALIDPETRKIVKPLKNMSLIQAAGGKVVDLCGKDKNGEPNFGKKLAEVGQVIQEKTSIQSVKISLSPNIPRPGSIVVTYNGKALKAGEAWSYDEVYNKIEVHSAHPDIAKQPGGKIGVEFTPVDPQSIENGRVIPVGF